MSDHAYRTGDVVLVEAVVIQHNPGNPYGSVTVSLTGATDPQGMADTIEAVVPEALVEPVRPDPEPDFGFDIEGERDHWTDPDDRYAAYYVGELPW